MKGSFFAMAFFPSFEQNVCVRSLRKDGFKTPEQAIQALQRKKLEGYVKRLGQTTPIWSNVS